MWQANSTVTSREGSRVAAPMSFGYRHLSPVVTDFLRAHPQVDIELDLNDRRVDLISEGFDIAVRIGSLPDSSIISRTLAPCRHAVCASPAYLANHGWPLTPTELAFDGHVCLAYNNRPRAEQWRFLVDGVWTDVPVKARHIHSNNGDILCEAAIAGLGIIVLPTFIVNDAVGDWRIGRPSCRIRSRQSFDPCGLATEPPRVRQGSCVRRFARQAFRQNPLLG